MSTTSTASTPAPAPAPRPPTSTTSESQSLFGEEVESVPVENSQQQGTKRRTTSDVWNRFKKKNIDGKVKAQCNYCGRLMVGAKDQKASRRDLARMVILHEYPLAIVDHVGFRDFVGGLRPNFKIVGRNTLKRDIKKNYNEKNQKTMVEIDKNASKVAITTDLWTANNSKRSFMLSAITVDNASNNDGMMKLILDKLQASSLILGGKLLHVRCAAHILNLVVQEGLNVIGDGIEKVRSSVYFWTQSPKRTEIFEKISRQSHIASIKELVLDCRTRWNSTYLMLSTALIYKDVFPRLLCCEPQYQSAPTNRDWEVAQIVCEKLGYFHKVTELLSGTAYPTTNHYFPSVFQLKMELNQWLSSEDELVKKMAAKMLTKFDKYWSDVHDIMSLTIVLDPRYKLMLLTFFFNKMYGSKANEEIDKHNGSKYPTLQRIARDILAIPMTTVASESAFSTSGRLLSPHRSRLHHDTLEALMCGQNWLWSELKGVPIDATIQNVLDDYEENEVEESHAMELSD
ncbi:hypothetical protein SO802_027693 [Lithocarpus litseifolius]|uniref:hAT-like transposase RNase-H fold domain-containing protein n=1 Tax=Lithocarpus litseifolius TaxID=425828 RepID=A0AAW2C435_9ROSI